MVLFRYEIFYLSVLRILSKEKKKGKRKLENKFTILLNIKKKITHIKLKGLLFFF